MMHGQTNIKYNHSTHIVTLRRFRVTIVVLGISSTLIFITIYGKWWMCVMSFVPFHLWLSTVWMNISPWKRLYVYVLLFSSLLSYVCRLQYETHLVLHVRCSIFLSDFNQIWIQSTQLIKSLQDQTSRISNEGETSRTCGMTDRQTDKRKGVKKQIGTFRDWCERPYKYRDTDKSLARPERKRATATEDFDVHISYL
jgi:hypothetical protein